MNAPSPHDDALRLLRSLSGPAGIRASATATANYAAVFTRDAVMAGVAGLLAGDAVVVDGFLRTLEHLRDLQGAEGQIASNYLPRDGAAPRISFGTLVPRLDAPLWYVIGVALGARAGVLAPAAFRDSVGRVFRLLDALEYNGRHLLYVPVGGDWADEYVNEGYVLHDQVLRAWGARLAGETFDEPAWMAKHRAIEGAIAESFWPDVGPRRHPLAAVSPARIHDAFDLATAALLGVSGIAAPFGADTAEWIAERFLAPGTLPPAFDPVIAEGDADWPALRRYQLHGFRNRPHEYHNGGVWPIWLGWLALALARLGRMEDLRRLRRLVADRLAAAPGFRFDEYFHGRTGAPGGTPEMAYSATGLLMLEAAGSAAQERVLGP